MRTRATTALTVAWMLLMGVLVMGSSQAQAQVDVSIPDVEIQPGETVTVPVEVGDLTGEGVTSYDFRVQYDSQVVEVTGAEPGPVTGEDAGNFVDDTSGEGEVSVAFAGSSALSGSGTLVNLQVRGASSGSSPLSFGQFQFNEGQPSAQLDDGSATVADAFVSLPDLTEQTGNQIQIPVETSDLTGQDVTSYEFDVAFDTGVVDITGVDAQGTLSEGLDPQFSVSGGVASVAVASGQAIEGSGELIRLEADVVGSGTSPLTFDSFQFNEGTPAALTTDGSLQAGETVVSFPTVGLAEGQTRVVEISTSDLTGLGVTSYEFEFSFDPSVVQVSDTVITEGTQSEGTNPQIQVGDGTATIATASGTEFEGDAPLVGVEIERVGSGTSPLSFTQFQFNEGSPSALTVDGQVETSTNSPPSFTSVPGDTSVAAQQELAVTVDAEDPDGDEIEFSLAQAPQGAAIDSASGDFTWTPTVSQADSTYDITVRASDGASSSDASFAVTVEPPQARAQIIHNAADPAAETVDVYFGDSLAVDGLSFRSATQYVDVPAETEIDVGIAPGNSSSVADTLASFPVTFASGQAHTVVANGVLNPDDFADNPDGQDIGLTLFADAQAQESGTSADSVDIRAVHGATDAPTVDIDAGGATLFDDVTYGALSGYISAAPASVRLDVTPGGSDDVVASFQADLSGLGGQSATVLASGFLDPSANQDGPAFGLVAVLADGSVVEFPANEAPQFTEVPSDTSATVGEELTATVEADDPEGDDVAFSLTDAPDGAAIDSASGDFSWTPTDSQADSTYEIGVRASDGQAASDTSFAVTVEEANDPPQFTDVPSDTSVSVGEELTATVGADDPNGDDVAFSLTDAPDGAAIDSASGDFSWTPTDSQAGSTFNIGVRASDGQATSDTSFAVTVEQQPDQSPITVDINRSFGDATQDANYRLVGLPGQVDLPIEETLSGEPGESNDWRAFWDDGSTNGGLVEFDGSDQFNFRAGRGFWVLTRNNWTVQDEYDPVSLGNNASASIPLNDGWTIISNPLGEDVSWSDVQDANGVSEPLWSFSGSFSQASTFASAQSGEAFYFLNNAGLDSLQIPFPTSSGSSAVASKDESGQTLRLDALVGGQKASSVWVGMRPGAESGKDKHDHFAPPSYFTNATLSVQNGEIESPYALASDVRPADAEGHTYNLVLETESDERLALRARGLSSLDSDQQVRLFNEESGRSVDLRSTPTADVKASPNGTEFALLVGSASYVQQQASELTPEELELRQNYPNPFQAQEQTTIEYSLPEQTEVTVGVYDILGRRVHTLVDGKSQRAGVHTLKWDGRNGQGQTVASGIYFTRLEAGQTRTIKMVVID